MKEERNEERKKKDKWMKGIKHNKEKKGWNKEWKKR